MQAALTLLISAFQLLTMVAHIPNLPQSFKDSAISIANQAIAVAKDEVATADQSVPTNQSATITVQNIQPVAPTFGVQSTIQSVIIPVMDKSEIKTTVTKIKQGNSDAPFGVYFVKVEVLGTDGNNINGLDVTMNAQDNLFSPETEKIDTVLTLGSKGYYHTFVFQPTSVGTKTIDISSNNMNKSVTVEVQ